jgi:16S rRNA (cytidine1402-2'-O)-methyltransferase
MSGRHDGRATLYVVATPIGNLDDITLRALKVLKAVELVAAEDTRRTGNLLRHYGIETPVLSVHAHNERARIDRIIGHLDRGSSVALVTDAGTPAVSDPGAALVAAIRDAGFRIEPLPGASAIAAAFSASGVQSDGFTFLAFPPIRSKDRKVWLSRLQAAVRDRAVIFFEAPHRLLRTLEELSIYVNRPIMAARELTKIHEELVWGTPSELIDRFQSPQGEFTIVIPPSNQAQKSVDPPTDAEIVALFGQITDSVATKSKKDAARLVGEQLGLAAREVYAALERHKLG